MSSPRVSFQSDLGTFSAKFYLLAQRKNGEQPSYFVVVSTGRGSALGWAFWREAYDQDGNKFTLARDAADVLSGGDVWEMSSALVGRKYLEAIKLSGTAWKIYGDHASDTFRITPNLIQGFLSRCDEQFKTQ